MLAVSGFKYKSRLPAFGAALFIALLSLTAGAGPAGAHAELSSIEPRSGQVLQDPPKRIRLNFSEPVSSGSGAIRLFDARGTRIPTPPVSSGGQGESIEVQLPELGDGGYVVTWRAVSADSHPLDGAFTFRVGESADAASGALVEKLLASQGGSPLVGLLHGLARLASYIGLIVLIGGAAFLLVTWPDGRAQPRARLLLATAWGVSFVATLAVIGLQGPYGEGLSLLDGLDSSVLWGVLTSRFGMAWLARLALLGAALTVWFTWPRRAARQSGQRPGRAALLFFALLGLGLAATPALSGHAAAGSPAALLVALDTLHFAAVSWWLGGLAFLLSVVLRKQLVVQARTVAKRFSKQALWLVGVIVVTGSAQGFVHTGSPAAITDTLYGQMLAAKVLLFLVIVGFAAAGRRGLHRLGASTGANETSDPDLGRLRRTAGAEVLAAGAVLVITALLVNLIPARAALALPASGELTAGSTLVEVSIEPAKSGPIDLHLYSLTPEGQVTEVEDMTAELILEASDIELEVPLQRAGPGHFAAYGFDLPIAGEWELEVAVRASGITIERGRTTFRIR